MGNILLSVLPPIATVIVTAMLTRFFTRKKQAAEIESLELGNVEKATAIWRELAEGLNKKVDEISQQNKELKQEVRKLEAKVQSLTSENRKLTELIKKYNVGDTK